MESVPILPGRLREVASSSAIPACERKMLQKESDGSAPRSNKSKAEHQSFLQPSGRWKWHHSRAIKWLFSYKGICRIVSVTGSRIFRKR